MSLFDMEPCLDSTSKVNTNLKKDVTWLPQVSHSKDELFDFTHVFLNVFLAFIPQLLPFFCFQYFP